MPIESMRLFTHTKTEKLTRNWKELHELKVYELRKEYFANLILVLCLVDWVYQ